MSADPALVFVDAHILVYAYDKSTGQKRERARSLLAEFWKAVEEQPRAKAMAKDLRVGRGSGQSKR